MLFSILSAETAAEATAAAEAARRGLPIIITSDHDDDDGDDDAVVIDADVGFSFVVAKSSSDPVAAGAAEDT